MHLEIHGYGPPLVLIHGWAMHGGIFAPLLGELTPHFECHVVDLPGHGLSEERDGLDLDRGVERLLAATPPAPWLGWSLGGLFALEAALRAPERVPALIAVAASPRFVVAPDWPHAVAHSVFEQFASDLASDYGATIERFIALEVHGDAHARDEMRWLRERLAQRPPGDPRILADGLAILAASDLRSDLPRLAVPSLWIAGQRDRLVPWQALQAAAALAPGGQFQRIDRAGHAPFLSDPQTVAAAIRAFAQRSAEGKMARGHEGTHPEVGHVARRAK
jgi:pimeloyl-[acyl-carrier protein] methyl ester esterase